MLYDKYYTKNPNGRGQDVGQIWRFLHEMQIGDYVILGDAPNAHLGKVVSTYYFDNSIDI